MLEFGNTEIFVGILSVGTECLCSFNKASVGGIGGVGDFGGIWPLGVWWGMFRRGGGGAMPGDWIGVAGTPSISDSLSVSINAAINNYCLLFKELLLPSKDEPSLDKTSSLLSSFIGECIRELLSFVKATDAADS